MIASRSDRREESKIDGALLVIFAGPPGTGKTTIARALARDLGAVYLRIDSIEQAILASDGGSGPIDDRGYRVANAVAEDNLRLGRTVIADSVNPVRITAMLGSALPKGPMRPRSRSRWHVRIPNSIAFAWKRGWLIFWVEGC